MSKHDNRIELLARGVCAVNDRLLFCHSKGAGNTYLPGGHVEFEESARDALRREIAEELGVEPRVGDFLGAVEHTFIQKGKRHCEVNLVFRLELEGADPSQMPESRERKIEFGWIPVSGLAHSNLEPAPLRNLIPEWLTSAAHSAKWGSSY
jgi:ADP-ribose pyrophosphatase YjhB (NUDIX family)